VSWRYYLEAKYPKLENLKVTKAMAQYLTVMTSSQFASIHHIIFLARGTDRLIVEVGVTYYVLAIDEINMLHDISMDQFRHVVASISNAMLKDFKNFFVLFAGKQTFNGS
jgi:hypothetical protein